MAPASSSRPLDGRLAVVTGASRGIGQAVGEAFQRAGARVVRLARSVPEKGDDHSVDVSDPLAVERAAAATGTPDILVHAAGTFLLKPLVDTTPEEFARQIDVNLTGSFGVLRAFLPGMLARGRGLVITIGSIADHTIYPGNAAYGASKTGLRGLHQVMAAELAGTGVRATLLSPGPVDTAMWDAVAATPGIMPRPSMLRPEDVAEAVLFVATRPEHVTIPEMHVEPRR